MNVRKTGSATTTRVGGMMPPWPEEWNGKMKALVVTVVLAWAGWLSMAMIETVRFHQQVLDFMETGERFTAEDYLKREAELHVDFRQEFVPREVLEQRLENMDKKLTEMSADIKLLLRQ